MKWNLDEKPLPILISQIQAAEYQERATGYPATITAWEGVWWDSLVKDPKQLNEYLYMLDKARAHCLRHSCHTTFSPEEGNSWEPLSIFVPQPNYSHEATTGLGDVVRITLVMNPCGGVEKEGEEKRDRKYYFVVCIRNHSKEPWVFHDCLSISGQTELSYFFNHLPMPRQKRVHYYGFSHQSMLFHYVEALLQPADQFLRQCYLDELYMGKTAELVHHMHDLHQEEGGVQFSPPSPQFPVPSPVLPRDGVSYNPVATQLMDYVMDTRREIAGCDKTPDCAMALEDRYGWVRVEPRQPQHHKPSHMLLKFQMGKTFKTKDCEVCGDSFTTRFFTGSPRCATCTLKEEFSSPDKLPPAPTDFLLEDLLAP